MHQFAVAAASPRSIAWLVSAQEDEWDRVETIIKYNCALLGGYFNVLIPLSEYDTLSPAYQRFLLDYDPDLLILAPGMSALQLHTLTTQLHPFCALPWELVSQVASFDPMGGGTGRNESVVWAVSQPSVDLPKHELVAVADPTEPDTSRLAFVVCGDVEPREPMWHVMDEDVSLSATGYREMFLRQLLKPEHDRQMAGAYCQEDGEVIPAPDRYQLAHLIKAEHHFPLSGAAKILEACCRLQHFPLLRESFATMTAAYKTSGGTPQRTYYRENKRPPGVIILVSENFCIEEAILFWNLRARECHVAWLSLFQLESQLDAIITWLNSDYGGAFYTLATGSREIAFSPSDGCASQVRRLAADLQCKGRPCSILSRESLIYYDYVRPTMKQERVLVTQEGSRCTFVPPLSAKGSGMYALTLEWDGLMVPQEKALVHSGISSERAEYDPFVRGERQVDEQTIMPRFRIAQSRYLRVQICRDTPLTFTKPSPEQIVQCLFALAGYQRIEINEKGKYELAFIQRAGNLEEAAHYLARAPYRELLESLADTDDAPQKKGWLLKHPDRRRALLHSDLLEVVQGIPIPVETERYLRVSDALPEEALDLLRKGFLERGFLLKCSACAFLSWYPAEKVGQTFECARCFLSQVYLSNPAWLYKLSEVTFQGFRSHMEVPLLALNYLKSRSQHAFEWMPDVDIYTSRVGNGGQRNIDVLCLSDGKLYLGEAKSNGQIEEEQLSFYEHMCRQLRVDGLVFATSQLRWNPGSLKRLNQLKDLFNGELLILTHQELYAQAESSSNFYKPGSFLQEKEASDKRLPTKGTGSSKMQKNPESGI